jgi:hypothetical protein
VNRCCSSAARPTAPVSRGDGRSAATESRRPSSPAEGGASLLAKAVGDDLKGKLSPELYLIAIPAAFINQWISAAPYVRVALIWLIPDRRIEHVLTQGTDERAR